MTWGRQGNPGSGLTRQPRTRRLLCCERLEPRNLFAVVTMSAEEQLLIELINRARSDPVAEAARLNIDLNHELAPGTITAEAKAPLAPHQALLDAAAAHSADMLAQNYFSHTGRDGRNASQRARDAGYPAGAGENLGRGGTTGVLDRIDAVYAQHDGLFLSPGHRQNLLLPGYREVGTGIRYGPYVVDGITYNSILVTENFGVRQGPAILTGVAYTDAVVQDAFYTPLEGLEGVTITATNQATNQTFSEQTGRSGGYALEVPPGTYHVEAHGPGFAVPVRYASITVAASNIKLDFIPGSATAPIPQDDAYSIIQGQTSDWTVLANDLDPDGQLVVASVNISLNPSHGTAVFDPELEVVRYAAAPDFAGIDTLVYQMDDRGGNRFSATVTIYVNPTQASPHTNPFFFLDVDRSGAVTSRDVFMVVSEFLAGGSRELSGSPGDGPFLDPTGDGRLSSRDVLMVASFLVN